MLCFSAAFFVVLSFVWCAIVGTVLTPLSSLVPLSLVAESLGCREKYEEYAGPEDDRPTLYFQ